MADAEILIKSQARKISSEVTYNPCWRGLELKLMSWKEMARRPDWHPSASLTMRFMYRLN